MLNILNKMKSKKAIVLPETLKLVIAVMCIIVLIAFAVQIYSLMHVKTELEQARAHLDSLTDLINNLNNEGQTMDFILLSPKGWFLLDGRIFGEDPINNFCPGLKTGDSCLCMCGSDASIGGQLPAKLRESCQNMNICKEFKGRIINFDTPDNLGPRRYIKIDDLLEMSKPISVSLQNNQIYLTAKND